MPEMGFVQSQSMKQQMKLSPQIILSANLMSLPSDALTKRIYEEVEKNPALEITRHATIEPSSIKMSQHYGSATRSDEYQSFLESVPVPEETLQTHLQSQLDLLKLDENEYRVGYQIIHNIDGHGYNVEDPETLLNVDDDFTLMEKMLYIVRRLDPPGTACKDLQQTLLEQSKIKLEEQFASESEEVVPPLVFVILSDYFSLIPKRPSTIYKILSKDGVDCTLAEIERVKEFIRTLHPYPSSSYSVTTNAINRYIEPEAIIKLQNAEEVGEASLIIDFLHGNLPEIEVSSLYEDLLKAPRAKTESEVQRKKFASEFVNKANIFIEALEQRKQALHKIITTLVYYQSEYFKKGPGHLHPLRMADIAEKCKVDESTVSRISNDKYVQCEWGLIELKSLFTGAIQTTKKHKLGTALSEIADSTYSIQKVDSREKATAIVSRDSVLYEIKNIIEKHERSGATKTLSDQKISDILARKGIKVARRTVSKYRGKLNIDSSYNR
ncbi:MAG: RNA polymerase sigma-54 factor [Treponema sp. CETP13]|nr:MAG: RNA polymerase sigma-54 factor [Treponema sp. CETP13]